MIHLPTSPTNSRVHCALLALAVLLVAVGCGSDDDAARSESAPVERVDDIDGLGERLADGLPSELAGFGEWLKLNSEPIPPKAADPHLGDKDVFYNGTAAEARAVDAGEARYPDGSVIVKSATRPDADFVGLIAVMRKLKGIDAEHNDWEFVEYTRESRDDRFEIIARDAICWTCHADASAVPTNALDTARAMKRTEVAALLEAAMRTPSKS